jgi:hypothetical protein
VFVGGQREAVGTSPHRATGRTRQGFHSSKTTLQGSRMSPEPPLRSLMPPETRTPNGAYSELP